ncbi:MAG: hypothetical protein KF767_08450 [Bdellovibrionaceae bacterium]|nr:hypothetical protein [Pseudobdellovibrionaceae bacterium]
MMKLTLVVLSLIATQAFAQSANIKDLPLDGEEGSSTTITIEKNKPGTRPGQATQPVQNEVLDSSVEIEGEAAPLTKAAKANWKKACDDWKKEVKELNKDNQILSMNCGSSRCAPEATAMTVCKSTATYKIRLKLQ